MSAIRQSDGKCSELDLLQTFTEIQIDAKRVLQQLTESGSEDETSDAPRERRSQACAQARITTARKSIEITGKRAQMLAPIGQLEFGRAGWCMREKLRFSTPLREARDGTQLKGG